MGETAPGAGVRALGRVESCIRSAMRPSHVVWTSSTVATTGAPVCAGRPCPPWGEMRTGRRSWISQRTQHSRLEPRNPLTVKGLNPRSTAVQGARRPFRPSVAGDDTWEMGCTMAGECASISGRDDQALRVTPGEDWPSIRLNTNTRAWSSRSDADQPHPCPPR
jgi:hypothetical protein